MTIKVGDFKGLYLNMVEVHQLAKALGGTQKIRKILGGELVCRVESAEPTDFRVWKTVTLGGYSPESILTALEDGDCRVGDTTTSLIQQIVYTPEENSTKLDLVAVSVKDLGFLRPATIKEIYDRAISWGLELCPAETGPVLRIQHKSSVQYGMFNIAMSPVNVKLSDFRNVLCSFSINRGSPFTRSKDRNPVCQIGDVFVFVKPKKD